MTKSSVTISIPCLRRLTPKAREHRLAVFNFLGWDRTDYVEAEVGFSQPQVQGIELRDSSGKTVPIQVLRSRSNGGDGGLNSATIGFIARDVPAMGYAIYHVIPFFPAPNLRPHPEITAPSLPSRSIFRDQPRRFWDAGK